ncbi:MAG: hypothetical protein HY369_00205 [Candidatus Aenigmarchaeota archaeon]|nr:hypothetical protein [Candidatus Aenigmarchaeota archaeon]
MLPVLFQIGVGFGGFQQMLSNMVSLGFFQFLFPFLLALAIFYGVIKFAAGDRLPKSAAGLVSLILAFFVMLFASVNPGIVSFLQNISGAGLVAGTGILFLIILLGLLGFKTETIFAPSGWKWIFVLFIVAAALLIFFGAGAGFLLPSASISSDWWTIIFFIVILAVVMFFLRDEGSGGGAKPAAAPGTH